MTDKRKQRIRSHMVKTGMTYQAADNALHPTEPAYPHEDFCPSCDGPFVEYKFGGIDLSTYDHTQDCAVGCMERAPGRDATRCVQCRHIEPIIRTPPYGVSGHLRCPKCFEKASRAIDTEHQYVVITISVDPFTATPQSVIERLHSELTRLKGWTTEGLTGSALVEHYHDPTLYPLILEDPKRLLDEKTYPGLFEAAKSHPHPTAHTSSLRIQLYVSAPIRAIRKMCRENQATRALNQQASQPDKSGTAEGHSTP